MIKMREQEKPGKTPTQITVSMIDQDLKNGVSKADMAVKYGIKPWEVDEMFKHPFLKGRRPSRKKALSFKFVDDTPQDAEAGDLTDPSVRKYVTDEPIIDPNQITLHDAIDEAIESVEEIKDQMQETQEAIIDMLSPTEFETPEETIAKVNGPEITGIPNGDTMSDTDDDDEIELPSVEDTLNLVREQQEEELEMDDDTFEL